MHFDYLVYIAAMCVLNWIAGILFDVENKPPTINLKHIYNILSIHLLLTSQLKYIFIGRR